MALNPEYVGRTFEPSAPYEVTRVKIAEFATAIGETSPLCFDREAAEKAGYRDVIAPPTFAIVISSSGAANVIRDKGLGLDYSMVVHGEQRFEHARPLHAGDVVVTQTTIEVIKPIGKHTSLTTRTEIRTTGGEHICTALNTLVERGE
ncbi:MAG TPA: MaoC family dehydratase N-terminal domain-containing protein [Streptosporangiaceae bacterium]|nr:MaoC family dehydratase N-terminal domain-containing protein [Streptosporangiaceae bacterium]